MAALGRRPIDFLANVLGAPTPLMFGELVNRGGRFLLLLLVARVVGVESFGQWVIAVATGTVFANAADAGLITVVTTHIAANKHTTRTYVATLWTAGALTTLISSGLLLAITPILATGTSIGLLWFMGLGGIFENAGALLLSPLRAHERFRPEALIRGTQGLVLLIGGGLILLIAPEEQPLLPALFLAVGLLSTLLSAIASASYFGRISPTLDVGFLRRLFVSAAPAFGMTIAFFLYFRIDAYMLSFLRGDVATGTYGAAYNFAFGAAFLPLLFGRGMLSQFAAASLAAIQHTYLRAAKVTMGLSVALSAVLVAATPVLLFVYGSEFASARHPYLVLVLAQGLYFFTHLNHMLLFGRGQSGKSMFLTACALGTNVAVNFALIPPLGATGAALSMVTSEVGLLIVQLILIRSVFSTDAVAATRRLPGAEAA